MAATPVHPASSNAAVKARAARPPIARWRPGTWTSLTAGRNVVSTGGTVGPAGRSDPVRVCGFEGWRKVCASLESSSSVGATGTTSGATTRTLCGSSFCFGFSVECIGAPYSVRSHRIAAAGGFTLDQRRSCPTLHSGLTKARRYDGEYTAAYGNSPSGTRLRESTNGLVTRGAAFGSANRSDPVACRSVRSLAVISSVDATD